MKTETRFNIGDEVWFMENNLIGRGEVEYIYTTTSKNGTSVTMNVTHKDKNTDESYFYKSKQELIETL